MTLLDQTPPRMTCPAAITIPESGAPAQIAAFIAAASATDSCDAAPLINNDAPESFPLGTTTVTFTARDASGNSSTCTAYVTAVAPLPGHTIPTQYDCQAALAVAPSGNPPTRIREDKFECTDNAPCDSDPASGVCGFDVNLCFNVVDPQVSPPCAPPGIESWRLTYPRLGSRTENMTGNGNRLLAGVASLPGGQRTGDRVSFAPPLFSANACLNSIAVRVPLRSNRLRTKQVLLTRTEGPLVNPPARRHRDRDRLTLICRQ